MAFKKSNFGGPRAGPKRPFEKREGDRFAKKGGSDRRGPARERFELYDAQCAKCGKACQVPFRPTGGKPVLCRDCFSKQDDGARPARSGGSSEELREINRKLDRIMRALKIE